MGDSLIQTQSIHSLSTTKGSLSLLHYGALISKSRKEEEERRGDRANKCHSGALSAWTVVKYASKGSSSSAGGLHWPSSFMGRTPNLPLPSYANEAATTLKLFRPSSLYLGVCRTDFANSGRPFSPPPQSTNALFRAACLPQMVVFSASNPKPSCIFLGLPLLPSLAFWRHCRQ